MTSPTTGACATIDVLVTGATGFIGSSVVRELVEQGEDVTILLRSGSDTRRLDGVLADVARIEGDIRATAAFSSRLRPFDVCIHSAWYAEAGNYLWSDQNLSLICATLEFAAAMAAAGCGRIVGIGTCYEYDTTAGRLDEQSPTRPASPYAAAKLATAVALPHVPGMTSAWARLFWQYGPYEDPRRLVPAVVTSLLRGERAATTPGTQVRDFLHVEDVAAAVIAVSRSQATGVVNIGSGEPVTVRRVIETIGRAVGRPELLGIGDRPQPPDEPASVYADNARLRSLGWAPRHSLESGIADVVDWWRTRAAATIG